LKRHTDRSDNWIGEDCGIDHKTVRVIREELEASLGIPKLTKFKGKDGKARPREQAKQWEEVEASFGIPKLTKLKGKDGKEYPREQERKEIEKPRIEPVTVYHGDMLKLLPEKPPGRRSAGRYPE